MAPLRQFAIVPASSLRVGDRLPDIRGDLGEIIHLHWIYSEGTRYVQVKAVEGMHFGKVLRLHISVEQQIRILIP